MRLVVKVPMAGGGGARGGEEGAGGGGHPAALNAAETGGNIFEGFK